MEKRYIIDVLKALKNDLKLGDCVSAFGRTSVLINKIEEEIEKESANK